MFRGLREFLLDLRISAHEQEEFDKIVDCARIWKFPMNEQDELAFETVIEALVTEQADRRELSTSGQSQHRKICSIPNRQLGADSREHAHKEGGF